MNFTTKITLQMSYILLKNMKISNIDCYDVDTYVLAVLGEILFILNITKYIFKCM